MSNSFGFFTVVFILEPKIFSRAVEAVVSAGKPFPLINFTVSEVFLPPLRVVFFAKKVMSSKPYLTLIESRTAVFFFIKIRRVARRIGTSE